MRNGINAFVMLGRDPIVAMWKASEPNRAVVEDDFRGWAAFVTRNIDKESALLTHVDTRSVDSARQSNILATLNPADECRLHDALQALWNVWVALGCPRRFLEDEDDEPTQPRMRAPRVGSHAS